MSSNRSPILNLTLPEQSFERLEGLWQEVSQLSGQEMLLVTEQTLYKKTKINLKKIRFSLIVSKEICALLVARELENDSNYRINFNFDLQEIKKFISNLNPELVNKKIKERLDKAMENSIIENSIIQDKFIDRLLQILVEEINYSQSYYPGVAFAESIAIDKVFQNRLDQQRIIDRLRTEITQNTDLVEIVKMTIEQVRHLLEVDRLVIYQLNLPVVDENKNTKYVDIVNYETRKSEEITSILYFQDEVCFSRAKNSQDKYYQGFTLVVNDVKNELNSSPCLQDLMDRLNIKAKLVAPIIVKEKLWGFTIAHQCSSPRQWLKSEIQFLSQIAEYLAIAIEQAESYQQLQEQKKLLENQVKTRAKQLREALIVAQIASRSKNEFIDNISHELRTPLTCVIGLSGTLLHWALDSGHHSLSLEKQRQYLKTIQDSGKQLLQLIDRILDFSIVESGKSLLKMSEFSLYDLARLVLHQLEEDAESKQIELQLDCRLDIDTDFFRGDRDRLQQILLNLISNGIKFTPAGGKVVLRIWQEKERAFFAVEDTGIGIPSQQLPLLFKKFQQLDSSRQRTYNGAGLGLALTKQLIELHGGKIEVNSIPKKGSTFTFYLPTNSPDKKQINSSITISDKIMSKTRTIVLIEEDEELATLICELLTAGNCQIVWLVDASDAIEQIELLEPILTIIDCRINNFQQLAQLLKSSPKTRHIKIMGLRSALPKNNWENCSQPEIDDYLIEPIQPTILLEKINNLF